VSIPRNSKSAACRMAPSQMAVGAEISGSVMRARYRAGTAQGESLKVALGSALNHDHTNRVVIVPKTGAQP
jgi:hypothetical protein